jgi:hypothetical protein
MRLSGPQTPELIFETTTECIDAHKSGQGQLAARQRRGKQFEATPKIDVNRV